MKRQSDNQEMGVIGALAGAADIEIIPLRGIDRELAPIPQGTTVTVTCSAKFGLERTLEYSEIAVKAGFRVVPHLAARQVTDEAHLAEFVERIRALEIRDLYVIGGDAPEPAGIYTSSAELLETLAGLDHGLSTIGVACYPEGHPSISDEVLLEALRLKQARADYMVSQLCFEPDALVTWLREMRRVGIELPLHIGLAAPLQLRKLFDLSLKIGVGTSVRYLTKQHGFIGNVVRGNSYRPEEFLLGLGDALAAPELRIEALHLFSFNQIAATVEWQQRLSAGKDETKA